MRDHPVTPMREGDLRRHLGEQTDRSIGRVDLTALESVAAADAAPEAASDDDEIVVLDAVGTDHLETIGRVLWDRANEVSGPLFVIGSSGVQHHSLVHAWEEDGRIDREERLYRKRDPSTRCSSSPGARRRRRPHRSTGRANTASATSVSTPSRWSTRTPPPTRARRRWRRRLTPSKTGRASSSTPLAAPTTRRWRTLDSTTTRSASRARSRRDSGANRARYSARSWNGPGCPGRASPVATRAVTPSRSSTSARSRRSHLSARARPVSRARRRVDVRRPRARPQGRPDRDPERRSGLLRRRPRRRRRRERAVALLRRAQPAPPAMLAVATTFLARPRSPVRPDRRSPQYGVTSSSP